MERRRQRGGVHHAGAAAGFDKSHLVIPADFVFHPDTAIELDKIGADAEEDMLAVVDDFAGSWMLVGRCASAEIRPALKERDAKAGIGERAGGGESSQTPAGYGD